MTAGSWECGASRRYSSDALVLAHAGFSRLWLAAGVCLTAFAGALGGQPSPAPPLSDIYQRAAVEFQSACFFKPIEAGANDTVLKLAPLIIQETKRGGGGRMEKSEKRESGKRNPEDRTQISQDRGQDAFGSLSLSNEVLLLDLTRPAVYFEQDAVRIQGREHARFTYIWCYTVEPDRGSEERLPMQGIRLTLDSAGQPAVWEVLADATGAELIYVALSLEGASRDQFGKPEPGRRYTIERSLSEAPKVIVPRILDDGPMPMGPIVYLSAGTRSVSTLICRCMSAQAKQLVATSTFELKPARATVPNSLITKARLQSHCQVTFWPGDQSVTNRLEQCLRLPSKF